MIIKNTEEDLLVSLMNGYMQSLSEKVVRQNIVLDESFDIQSTESIEICFADTMQETGRLDVLVNNAGAGFIRTTEHATEAEVEWVMDVNFKGVVRCTKAALPMMRTQNSGHIVNISLVGGFPTDDYGPMFGAYVSAAQACGALEHRIGLSNFAS